MYAACLVSLAERVAPQQVQAIDSSVTSQACGVFPQQPQTASVLAQTKYDKFFYVGLLPGICVTRGAPFTNMVQLLIRAWISNYIHYELWD